MMTIGNVRSMSTNAVSAMYFRRKREGRMPHKMADKAKKLRGLRYSCRQIFLNYMSQICNSSY